MTDNTIAQGEPTVYDEAWLQDIEKNFPFAIHTIPPLREVIAALRAAHERIEMLLGINRDVWPGEIIKIGTHLYKVESVDGRDQDGAVVKIKARRID